MDLSEQERQTNGNLMAYKVYIRPVAQRVYGHHTKGSSEHQKNVHQLLRILFVNGSCTTWEMAKTKLHKIEEIREQEKIYRRLLIGRFDRGKYSSGIVDIGLVVKGRDLRKPYMRYRLSLSGILYCIDVLKPTGKEMDRMTEQYAPLLPKVFGRWKQLRRDLRQPEEGLQILAKGLYLNNILLARDDNPLYELMSFVHIKYRRHFESISEYDLAEQASYWYYTFLLYRDDGDKMRKVLARDEQLRQWYVDFFREAKKYYAERARTVKDTSEIFAT